MEDEEDNYKIVSNGRTDKSNDKENESNKRVEILEMELKEMIEMKESLESELEQSQSYCKSYTQQLTKGSEYVTELQNDIKIKNNELSEFKISQEKFESIIESLKIEIKNKTEENKSNNKKSNEIETTLNLLEKELMSATDLVQGLESKVQGLESQLLDQKNENSEHKLKIEKLEKIQIGQKKGSGRSSGGYDANVDRISDLEEELEHLKTQMKKINIDSAEESRLKLEELNYYKEQSEEYLKKLQEVRTLRIHDPSIFLFIDSFLLFLFSF